MAHLRRCSLVAMGRFQASQQAQTGRVKLGRRREPGRFGGTTWAGSANQGCSDRHLRKTWLAAQSLFGPIKHLQFWVGGNQMH